MKKIVCFVLSILLMGNLCAFASTPVAEWFYEHVDLTEDQDVSIRPIGGDYFEVDNSELGYGVIDSSGNAVLPVMYDEMIRYIDAKKAFLVEKDDVRMLVNGANEEVLRYDVRVPSFSKNGLGVFDENDKYGVIDIDNVRVLEPEFSSVRIYDETIVAKKDDKTYVYDITTQEILGTFKTEEIQKCIGGKIFVIKQVGKPTALYNEKGELLRQSKREDTSYIFSAYDETYYIDGSKHIEYIDENRNAILKVEADLGSKIFNGRTMITRGVDSYLIDMEQNELAYFPGFTVDAGQFTESEGVYLLYANNDDKTAPLCKFVDLFGNVLAEFESNFMFSRSIVKGTPLFENGYANVEFMKDGAYVSGLMDKSGALYLTDKNLLVDSNGLVHSIAAGAEKIGTITYKDNYNAETGISIVCEGQILESDSVPQMKNDRVLVPMRVIFEALGAQVSWDDAYQIVTAEKEDTKIEMMVGTEYMMVNGEPVKLDVASELMNGRTMIPVRAISEALGYKVSWDDLIQTVNIE